MQHRTALRLTAAFAAIALAAGCSSASDQGSGPRTAPSSEFDFDLEGQTIRLGLTQPSAYQMGSYYSRDLLEQWGANVETQVLGKTTGVEAIVAGQLDVAARSQEEALRGSDSGADLTAIGSWLSSIPYVLITKKEVSDIADLKGRNLAVAGPASFDNLMFRYILENEGLDPESDVTFTALGAPPDRTSAMLSGRVDAALLFVDGWISIEEQADDLKNLGYLNDTLPDPGIDNGFWYGDTEFLKSSGDVPLAIACANLEANAWAKDKDAFVSYTLDHVKGALEPDVAAAYDEAQRLNMFPTTPEELLKTDRIDNLVGILSDHDVVKDDLDPKQIVDSSYLEEAAEMGCGS